MGVLFVLLCVNLLTMLGAVMTGYEAHEVAGYLALNMAAMGLIFSVMSLNGIKNLYEMIYGKGKEDAGKAE